MSADSDIGDRLNAGVADLHMHTTASDGTCSVAERIGQARDRGLAAIAVTDHDRIAPSITAPVERRDDVALIAGVEVRADLFETKIELLGYFVDPDAAALDGVLSRARRYRRERNRDLVARLADETGLDLDYDRLASDADGSLGRPHLAGELVDAGVVDSVGEAFTEHLAEEGSCFVPMERVPYAAVLEAIHAAGGVASLAHPGRVRTDRISEMVAELAGAGLDGLEVRYSYGDRGPAYADVGVPEAAALADEHDLLVTGGSDCHGPGSGKFRIGEVRVAAADLRALARRAGSAEFVDRVVPAGGDP